MYITVKNDKMLEAFKECHRTGRAIIKNPNIGIITALRKYEKQLNRLGYDFTVMYDKHKKAIFIYSTDIIQVLGRKVYFNRLGSLLP